MGLCVSRFSSKAFARHAITHVIAEVRYSKGVGRRKEVEYTVWRGTTNTECIWGVRWKYATLEASHTQWRHQSFVNCNVVALEVASSTNAVAMRFCAYQSILELLCRQFPDSAHAQWPQRLWFTFLSLDFNLLKTFIHECYIFLLLLLADFYLAWHFLY